MHRVHDIRTSVYERVLRAVLSGLQVVLKTRREARPRALPYRILPGLCQRVHKTCSLNKRNLKNKTLKDSNYTKNQRGIQKLRELLKDTKIDDGNPSEKDSVFDLTDDSSANGRTGQPLVLYRKGQRPFQEYRKR
jgi:hypothetical protein